MSLMIFTPQVSPASSFVGCTSCEPPASDTQCAPCIIYLVSMNCMKHNHQTSMQPKESKETTKIYKNKVNRYLDKLPWPQELNNCTQNILSLAWRRTHHCVRILPCILQGLTWRNWRTTRNGLDGSYLMAPTWWLLVLLVLKPMKPMSVTCTACGNIWAFRCNSLQAHKHHHRTSQNHQPLGIVMNCLDKIACPSTLQPWVFSETMVKLKKIQSPCLESWCLWWSCDMVTLTEIAVRLQYLQCFRRMSTFLHGHLNISLDFVSRLASCLHLSGCTLIMLLTTAEPSIPNWFHILKYFTLYICFRHPETPRRNTNTCFNPRPQPRPPHSELMKMLLCTEFKPQVAVQQLHVFDHFTLSVLSWKQLTMEHELGAGGWHASPPQRHGPFWRTSSWAICKSQGLIKVNACRPILTRPFGL